ncbi:MAG: glycosyltransferase family 4 protein [Bacteroidetes bacterium]|nr:glycosyltransferase family 4 protein [Bacteroidota bacterium]
MKKIILVNQTANYLFADIIAAFSEKFPQYSIEAWYGTFDYDIKQLPPSVKLSQGPGYNRDTFKSRFQSWISFYFWMKGKIKQEDNTNTQYFFVSNPPLFVFLSVIQRLNFSCIIYDLYPEVLGGLNQSFLIKTIYRRWEKRNFKIFPRAKKIFTIGSGLKTAISKYTSENNIEIVPIWNKATKSASSRDFRKEWGFEGKKIILYSGNIGLTHPLEHLITIAEKLKDKKDWQIVIVGNGTKKPQLQSLANSLDNVTFQPPVPIEDLSALLSIATWGYVALDAAATNTSVPSKTFNILAAAVPVLAMVNEQSEIAQLMDKYKAGLHFSDDRIDELIAEILSVSEQEHKQFAANALNCSKDFTPSLAMKFTQGWIE